MISTEQGQPIQEITNNEEVPQFSPISVTKPKSSPMNDMVYRCHVVEQLKDLLINQRSLMKGNLEFLENLKDVMHRISNTIAMKQNKDDVFKSGGLKTICVLFNQIASFTFDDLTEVSVKQQNWKELEEIISDTCYILYKMAEHSRARAVMISTGVIYTMWTVAQRFTSILEQFFTDKNTNSSTTERPIARFYRLRLEANQQIESAIYHMNEIIELLSSELSLASDLTDLFRSANRHLYSELSKDLDGFGMQSCDVFLGFADLPLSDWSQESFDMFLENNTDPNYNLSLYDFDLNLHSAIINARTTDFLDRFFVKWNFDKSEHQNAGFYLLKRDQGVGKFILQKFCELLYTDSLMFTESDIHILQANWQDELNKLAESGGDTSEMAFSIDKAFEKGGIKILLESLRNNGTRDNVERLMNFREYQVVNTEASLFDEFDEKLLKQELDFFFNENQERDSVKFFHHKKDQIKDHARHTGGLEEDFTKVFQSIVAGGSDHDVLLSTEGNELGQVDQEVMCDEKYATHSSWLIGAQEMGGMACHRCILSARSEYMRKIFKYETSPKCLVKCEDLKWTNGMELFNKEVKTIEIPNLSYSTLSLIIRFIYCGENILKIDAKEEGGDHYQLLPQTYVECLIASDLFLLYPLKKFCELQILGQLESMKDVDQEFAIMLLNIALTYNCSDVFKQKCSAHIK